MPFSLHGGPVIRSLRSYSSNCGKLVSGLKSVFQGAKPLKISIATLNIRGYSSGLRRLPLSGLSMSVFVK